MVGSKSHHVSKHTHHIDTGPVATSVSNQTAATKNEFSGLANARQTPSYTAANNTPLTRQYIPRFGNNTSANTDADYHSFFYTLLSV